MATSKKSHGFDSQLERRLGATFGTHSKKKVPYLLKHTYNTDWLVYVKYPNNTKKAYLIEAKGIFRGSDRAKYVAIKEQYKELASHLKVDEVELIFIFQDPNVPVARTKTTHGEWAAKHGFRFYPEGAAASVLRGLGQAGEVTYG